MSFTINHTALAKAIAPVAVHAGSETRFTVNMSGTFVVLFPGEVHPGARAQVVYTTRATVETGDTPVRPGIATLHGGNTTTTDDIRLTLVIHDPSGKVFTAAQVTAADLQRFRDLRGQPGAWRYSLTGTSKPYDLDPDLHATVRAPPGALSFMTVETVPIDSAGPLVSAAFDQPLKAFQFDLHRVGNFVASISGAGFTGSMQLVDPDGAVVAHSTGAALRHPITLRDLAKSRTAAGGVRPWTLKAEGTPIAFGHPMVNATVVAEGRIATGKLLERMRMLLGDRGQNFAIEGSNIESLLSVLVTIKDPVAAETLDMLGLLDNTLRNTGQSTHIDSGVPFRIYVGERSSEKYGQTFTSDISSFRLVSIDVDFGPSTNLPGAAVWKLKVVASGGIAISMNGAHIADASLRDGQLVVEVGVQIDAEGEPRLVTWVPTSPMHVSYTAGANALFIAVGIGTPILGAIAIDVVRNSLQSEVDSRITDPLKKMFPNPSSGPNIFMMLFGGYFKHQAPRFEGTDVSFEYVAPLEPTLHPRAGYATALGDRGDTWAVPNLASKIDHIVVVMMENRSYDHVLGYRASIDGKDGLAPDVIAGVHQPMRPLSQAAFHQNSLGLRTAIPVPVGHGLADVNEQLGGQLTSPAGRKLNDPAGFVSNFAKHIAQRVEQQLPTEGTIATDVLGYYGAADLPMYTFLAQNFAYSDRYFASHPGPTMPNRMYSLTGDAQHDRYGSPILDNNSGDNFVLSRATTIYDLLAREGVPYRVYESFPSVTMLRMFARYASDDENIRSIDKLEADMDGDIPPVIVIEPAMHHAPENDDHPTCDMYRGQSFIRRVYRALSKNQERWKRTLLVITYDEHGGFYDHVVPPLAETLKTATTVATGPATSHPLPTTERTEVGASPRAHIPAVDVRSLEGEGPVTSIPFGVRVPTFIVSPQVPADAKPNVTLDHCSILKTILARFCPSRPFLSDRVAAASSLEPFVTAPSPRNTPPAPSFQDLTENDTHRYAPGASRIVTPILTRDRMRAEQVDFHDLSGRLARLLGR